ncbi:nitric oxide synthase-interacting protein, partial [Phenoliferia sp. Uapishka_3]
MPRHSRNNTNSASFSYAERQMLKAGTKKERLGRDAMKNYNSCSLCLDRAREPRVCTDGHIFCQECILNSLLSQKRDIKRQTVLLDRMRATEEEERVLARSAARQRVLKEFEHAQSGLGSKGTVGKTLASTTGTVGAGGEAGE